MGAPTRRGRRAHPRDPDGHCAAGGRRATAAAAGPPGRRRRDLRVRTAAPPVAAESVPGGPHGLSTVVRGEDDRGDDPRGRRPVRRRDARLRHHRQRRPQDPRRRQADDQARLRRHPAAQLLRPSRRGTEGGDGLPRVPPRRQLEPSPSEKRLHRLHRGLPEGADAEQLARPGQLRRPRPRSHRSEHLRHELPPRRAGRRPRRQRTSVCCSRPSAAGGAARPGRSGAI